MPDHDTLKVKRLLDDNTISLFVLILTRLVGTYGFVIKTLTAVGTRI
jgi:nitrate reductase NapE component